MSSSIKEIYYDIEDIKECSECKSICLKSDFHKDKNKKDGLCPQCKFCKKIYDSKRYNKNRDLILIQKKDYYNNNKQKILQSQLKYEILRRKTNPNFKLACNLRSRTNKAFKSQNVAKRNKTFDLIGCSNSFLKSWIEFQLYGEMTMENYGKVWQIDHCIAVSKFNLLNENEKRICFNWLNLRPMYVKENISKGNKIDMWLYLLQQVKANYFIKINEQETR